ncbi:sensor domain-containing diguanylate cyclase [Priestia abyssalis]|uniref:sensor domain-containing diguanylate cyclase n=1 Tax=Priestia abyssalis TaxID=1221450 RepID=UPI000994DCFD|nr:sensor domain-containing diguanylate cyclase [Priestia abyssalis]
MKNKSNIVLIFLYIMMLSFFSTSSMGDSYKWYVQGTLIAAGFVLAWQAGKQLKRAGRDYEGLLKRNEEMDGRSQYLMKENERLEQLFHNMDVIAFSYDVTSQQMYMSKAVERVYGFSRETVTGTLELWKHIVHPDDREEFQHYMEQWNAGTAGPYEHRIICPDGEVRWVEISVNPVVDSSGDVVILNGTIIDITKGKIVEEELKTLAFYDSLTDLPNRQLLHMYLKKALARSKRHEQTLTIMFIDLDGFKNVNDTLGHEAGDVLLKEVADRLHCIVREDDFVSRLGGDEFVIVLEEVGEQEAGDIAQRILDEVSLPYTIKEQTAHVSPSIGISIYPTNGENQEILIEKADQAMYFAKHNGKNNYQFYRPELSVIQPPAAGISKKKS